MGDEPFHRLEARKKDDGSTGECPDTGWEQPVCRMKYGMESGRTADTAWKQQGACLNKAEKPPIELCSR